MLFKNPKKHFLLVYTHVLGKTHLQIYALIIKLYFAIDGNNLTRRSQVRKVQQSSEGEAQAS